MKKLLAALLGPTMMFSLVACGGSTTEPEETTEAPTYKIGILTGTVSQGEEEFRAAEQMKAKYGDMIITKTYPDNFMKETETTIANFMSMASDPDVKSYNYVPGNSWSISCY